MFNSTDIYRMIEKKFASPAWVVFPEVSDATGLYRSRYADALAMSVWPSRGLEIHGFEIKCIRGDWLRELKNPAKSAEIQQYCDKWWIVAGDDGVVKLEELPSTWGLLVAKAGKLYCKKEPPQLKPHKITKAFLAAILRRSHENIQHIRNDARREGYEEGTKNGPDDHRLEMERLKRDIENINGTIKRFEEHSGININTWNVESIGEAVKKVLHYSYNNPMSELERLKNSAESVVKTIENEIKIVKLVIK